MNRSSFFIVKVIGSKVRVHDTLGKENKHGNLQLGKHNVGTVCIEMQL